LLDVFLVPRGRVLGLGRGLGVPKAAQVTAAKSMKTKSNPLPPANSRRPLCFRRLPETRCSLGSSRLGFPAAVAEGVR
jgi:hypothetical protein